jgi:DNA-binding CsgD family transcriptional regulator
MMSEMVLETDPLARGREALAQARWDEARAAFDEALGEGISADALDGLGRSLWWMRRIPEGIDARTRAYAEFRRAGRDERAAIIAVWLSREYRNLLGNEVAARGWLARAKRAASKIPRSRADGWISLGLSEADGDPGSAVDHSHRAVSIARDHEDLDLEVTALARLGVLQIAKGDLDGGMAALDEAMAAATAGEASDPQSVGEAYCALMEAMDLLGGSDRIEKWSASFDRYRDSYDYLPLTAFATSRDRTLSSFCGACCGGIYIVTGRLDDAEAELVSSIEALEASRMHSRCVHPVTQLAELRVIQGRLEEARSLLNQYEDLPEAVRPLASLDLALGSPEHAIARLSARIDELRPTPVRSLPLRAVLVDAHLAAGNTDAAAETARTISDLAALTRSTRHEGEAMFAEGKVGAAANDEEAPSLLRRASRKLSDASVPLLSCRARMELAKSLVESDRPVAISEARAALAAFERMGATAEADSAAAFLRDLGVTGRTGPKGVGTLSKREVEVLRLLSEGCSNAEIAERLFISVKTAGHHVSSILSKLGMRSRTEAAAYAVLNLSREPAGK